ncbi:hypothetical protein [Amycolatopsis pigmentata]|uniref:Uncharacterized protein n=1 Tax=Amycolatopsis pigmentata TaxID=450801 RepID=A0ABW5G9W4_9PSEU
MSESGWVKPKLPKGVVNCFAEEPNHKHRAEGGSQITPTTVRWECRCGATRDERDVPPPHG